MKGTKLVLSFWLSTAAFCLLQILFGPGGLTETARLRDQQARLEVRLEALRDENLRMTARYTALKTSTDAIRLEARALGWFQIGEIPVRTFDGAEFRLPSDEPDLSTVPRLTQESVDLTLFFRLAWPILFFSSYTFFSLCARLWPQKDRWADLVTIRRENLPVPFQAGLDFFRK